MLKRASIAQIKSGEISKTHGHLVIAMRVYPRFLSKALINEYSKTLSPEPTLFARYRDYKKQGLAQNEAFEAAKYQDAFTLSHEGLEDLKRLTEISRTQNVYLICQCAEHERCHVDLMLLLAEKRFSASIEQPSEDYPDFRARLRATSSPK